MGVRSPRRHLGGSSLEGMTDRELLEVLYFGNLVAADGSITYTAGPDDQERAREILRSRHAVTA